MYPDSIANIDGHMYKEWILIKSLYKHISMRE